MAEVTAVRPDLMAAMEASWPAADYRRLGPVTLRAGPGGGNRVSAATVEGDFTAADLTAADAAMQARGGPVLWQVRAGQAALDAALDARGLRRVEPVVVMAAPLDALAAAPEPMAAFAHWPPLEITAQIWTETGIGPGRRAVMQRAPAPKAAILGRTRDRPSGAAFVALGGPVAMVHAVAVLPGLRRLGTGRSLTLAAAAFARTEGAGWLGLAVAEDNAAARALYASLGLQAVEHYHYRAP